MQTMKRVQLPTVIMYTRMLNQGLCTYLSPEDDMRDAWRLVEGGAVQDTNMR